MAQDIFAGLGAVGAQIQLSSPLGAWARAFAKLGDGDPNITAAEVVSLAQRAASQVQLSSPLGALLMGSIRQPQHLASQVGAGPFRAWVYRSLLG